MYPTFERLLLVGVSAFATNAIVKHNVNLRSDPSAGNPPITLLRPPDQVELI